MEDDVFTDTAMNGILQTANMKWTDLVVGVLWYGRASRTAENGSHPGSRQSRSMTLL